MSLVDAPELYKSLALAFSRRDDERWRVYHERLRGVIRELEDLDGRSKSLGVRFSSFLQSHARLVLEAVEKNDVSVAVETLWSLERRLRATYPLTSLYAFLALSSRTASTTALFLALVLTLLQSKASTLTLVSLAVLATALLVAAFLTIKTPLTLALQLISFSIQASYLAILGSDAGLVVVLPLLLAALSLVSALAVNILAWFSMRRTLETVWRRGGDLNPRPPG